jgi:Fe2+ transport system protein B
MLIEIQRELLLWPLMAVLSLLCIVVICMLSNDVFIARFGNFTPWSFVLFLATILFAVASVASMIALWRASKQGVRGIIQIYSAMVTIALVISTIYLAYWGIIGLRTWI